jgi:hypothetical protein
MFLIAGLALGWSESKKVDFLMVKGIMLGKEFVVVFRI